MSDGTRTVVRVDAELDELTRAYVKELRAGVTLRTVARRFHEEVCGCEGDVCELGLLLEDVAFPEPPAVPETPLEEKLAMFDADADAVCLDLFFDLSMAPERRAELLALARSRHIAGHGLYGDRQLFEWDASRLARERDEELADAIIYSVVLRRQRRASGLDPMSKAEAA
jgi:hypothetical protein